MGEPKTSEIEIEGKGCSCCCVDPLLYQGSTVWNQANRFPTPQLPQVPHSPVQPAVVLRRMLLATAVLPTCMPARGGSADTS